MLQTLAKNTSVKFTLVMTLMLWLTDISRAEDVASPLLEASARLELIYKKIQLRYKQRQQLKELEASAPPADSEEAIEKEPEESLQTNTMTERFLAGEELIVDIFLNGTKQSSMLSVTSEQGLRFGLSEFAQVAGFLIDVTLEPPSAEGWFFDTQQKFTLKKNEDNSLSITANGLANNIPEGSYDITEDIFIELEDLADWFTLDFEFSDEKMALNLISKQKFPAELNRDRQARDLHKGSFSQQARYPVKNSDYQLYSPPMLDVQASTQTRETKVTSTTGGSRSSTSQSSNYSVLGSHDLAYFNTEFFFSGNDVNGLNSGRFTLSRQANETRMLGPLYATEYSIGDVVPVKAVAGTTQGLSRGFTVNNASPNQLADNQTANLVGEVPVGWDVELYRNGVLIDQQLNIQDGRYAFNDTPLVFGINDFEVLLYGPQGQRQSRTESYRVEGNTVNANQGQYRFSLVQVGESMLGVEEAFDDPTNKGLLVSTVIDYGLNDLLAFSVGSAIFEPEQGEAKSSYALGINANLGPIGLLSSSMNWDSDENTTLKLGYRTRWRSTSYDFNVTNNQRANTSPDLGQTQTRTYSVGMVGRLWPERTLPVSYENNWQVSEKNGQKFNETFRNLLGIHSSLGYFSNTLLWIKNELGPTILSLDEGGDASEFLSGGLQYRKGFGRLHTRFYANYLLKPNQELDALGTTIGYYWNNNMNMQLNYDYALPIDQHQTGVKFNWRFDALELGTSAAYYDNGSWYAGTSLRFSLGYDPLGERLFISGRPLTQSGALAVRVFEDLNMNDAFDAGEPTVANAKVTADQTYRHENTNDQGLAVIKNMYNQVTTDIEVDSSTLDGPFMITANQGVAVRARKGFVDQVEIPIVQSRELEGVVYRKQSSGEEEVAPYVTLHLLNQDNEVVASTRTEYDGFYLFTDIKPGKYSLKVDEHYAFRNGLKTPDQNVSLLPTDEPIVGKDFVLFPLDNAAGYIVSVGEFQSPEMLKLYYLFLKKKLGNDFEQMPFFIRGQDGTDLTLSLAYYEGAPEANSPPSKEAHSLCARLAQKNVNCAVQYRQFKY